MWSGDYGAGLRRWIAWVLAFGGIASVLGQFNYSRYSHDTWSKVSKSENIFSSRNGHATCQFKGRLWLLGGRTAEFETWNLQLTERNADVWYSEDGATWIRESGLRGDFEVQNFDVKVPGPIAPWYGRYGHTVDAMDITGDGQDDIMVLAGGFSPQPSNDIWVTEDGVTWSFVDYAPWSGRAWHASAVYKGALYILGGTPLNNEVWEGRITLDGSAPHRVWYGRAYLNSTWQIQWRDLSKVMRVPWSPRAGHKAAVQCKYNVGPQGVEYIDDQVKRENFEYPDTFTPFCVLYVMGGYGGFNESSFYFDGLRSLNDVWATRDGVNWTAATLAAPWAPRAFHDVVVWADAANKTQDVTQAGSKSAPRIWLAGGGYMGTKGNNIVYVTRGYIDLWWTRDGARWYRVDWEQGSGSFLFTTNTWAKTEVAGTRLYLGKWGHKLQRYSKGATATDALFLIGGTHEGSGDKVRDVWRSTSYVFCDLNGVTCSGEANGECGEGLKGCVCKGSRAGEYCEGTTMVKSGARRGVAAPPPLLHVLIVGASAALLWLTAL